MRQTFAPKNFDKLISDNFTDEQVAFLNNNFGLWYAGPWSTKTDKRFLKQCKAVLEDGGFQS